MKKKHHGIGWRAVIVEAVGLTALLMLVSPPAEEIEGKDAIAAVRGKATNFVALPGESEAATSGLPSLSLPAPPDAVSPKQDVTLREGPEDARAAFVQRELDYSRQAFELMFKRHMSDLLNP